MLSTDHLVSLLRKEKHAKLRREIIKTPKTRRLNLVPKVKRWIRKAVCTNQGGGGGADTVTFTKQDFIKLWQALRPPIVRKRPHPGKEHVVFVSDAHKASLVKEWVMNQGWNFEGELRNVSRVTPPFADAPALSGLLSIVEEQIRSQTRNDSYRVAHCSVVFTHGGAVAERPVKLIDTTNSSVMRAAASQNFPLCAFVSLGAGSVELHHWGSVGKSKMNRKRVIRLEHAGDFWTCRADTVLRDAASVDSRLYLQIMLETEIHPIDPGAVCRTRVADVDRRYTLHFNARSVSVTRSEESCSVSRCTLSDAELKRVRDFIEPYIRIRKSPVESAGMGVFWDHPKDTLPERTLLGQYIGDVFSKSYFDTLPDERGEYAVTSACDTFVVDAACPVTSNWTRFMNGVMTGRSSRSTTGGSRHKTSANCMVDERMCVWTVCAVAPGDELVWDYGEEYPWAVFKNRDKVV